MSEPATWTKAQTIRTVCPATPSEDRQVMARNARLAALRTFARFLVAAHPEQMITLRNVLGTPFKHGAKDG